MAEPHDAPSVRELVIAVREWLERDVIDGKTSAVRFNARVATNILAMVEREIALGPVHARRHRERLERLECSDDQELAARIRAGHLDHRSDEVRALVFESVCDKLAVANPSYVDDAT